MVVPDSSLFTMWSWLSWVGCPKAFPSNLTISSSNLLTSSLSWSFSWAMKSSQDSTSTCSILDYWLWEQQTLAQMKFMELSEHVHLCVGGWKCFTDATTTSWDTSSMTCASFRFSWEHLNSSWPFCIFTSLLVSTSSWVLRLAFSFSSGATQKETLVAQAYFFSKFSCLSIKEVWECLSFSCSSFRALSSLILPMRYSSYCSSCNSCSWILSKSLLILIISFLLNLSKSRSSSSLDFCCL
jgi:hypothetical protein